MVFVRFNGTTGAIIGSVVNVASVTKNATGDFTVNYSAGLASTIYKVQVSAETAAASPTASRTANVKSGTVAGGSCGVLVNSSGGALSDSDSVTFAAYGG